MPYNDFIDSVMMMNKGREEDLNNEKLLVSFGSWQIVETVKGLMLGKDNKSLDFLSYARGLDLIKEEGSKLDPKEIASEKEKALKTAEEILRIDRGQVNND